MINPMSLEGKKILITGASSGIGRATAIYCSELGAQLVIQGRNEDKLKETFSNLKGYNHIVLVKDFDNSSGFNELFENMILDGIKLDGFIYCTGIPYVMPVKSLTKDRLHSVMNINFYTFVELARIFTKSKYSNDNSSIIGISSSAVIHPRKYELGYLASKAAMEISIPVMAKEFWKRKIRVNCVSPGSVMTEMITNTLDVHGNNEALDEIALQTIMGWQQPDDIAKVCAFLLSDASKTITSQILRADGGYR